MKVELLFFDGCPSCERFLPRLEQLMRDGGVRADIEMRRVESPEAAKAERFLGSPTLRIDGQDIGPTAGERRDYGLNCRLYRADGSVSGVPPEPWVRDALAQAQRRPNPASP